MNAYIYQADLCCQDCGQKIIADLTRAGKAPECPQDESTFDSDDFPKSAGDDGGGESDCPQHCSCCGVPLENPLTSDGVNYVLESIRESLAEAVEKGRAQTWSRIMPLKGTAEEDQVWLHGKRHVDIVREWAQQIQNYSLEKDERAIVELFLELSI